MLDLKPIKIEDVACGNKVEYDDGQIREIIEIRCSGERGNYRFTLLAKDGKQMMSVKQGTKIRAAK